MKRCVYTVLTGHYDELRDPLVVSPGFDYICFTDNVNLTSRVWKIRLMMPEKIPVRQQRKIKILAHDYLPGYDLTVYVDANMELKTDLNLFLDKYFKGGLLCSTHPSRDCVYEEGKACIRLNKDEPDVIQKLLVTYQNKAIPEHGGLYETGFMVRDRSKGVVSLCEFWHELLSMTTHRDQLTLPVAVLHQKNRNKPPVIHGIKASIVRENFNLHKHGSLGSPQDLRIWYLTPYALDKKIGREYNQCIENLPDNDWICLRDGDTIFMQPESQWGKQIYDIALKHGKEFPLIGAVTNRLASTEQLYQKRFDSNPNYNEHKRRGKELFENHYDDVVSLPKPCAGMFMLFSKKTWQKYKFKEGPPYWDFDTDFGMRIMADGGKVGLAKGIYLFHDYRWGYNAPKKYKKHLNRQN